MIKGFLMAAVAAAGVASAADAATVVSYDIDLRYEGTTYLDVTFSPWDADLEDVHLDVMPLEGNTFGATGRYGHLSVGSIVKFVAEVIYTEDPFDTDTWLGIFDNGGRTLSCTLAGVSCGQIIMAFPGPTFSLYDWDMTGIEGSLIYGDSFSHWFWGPEVPNQYLPGGIFYAWFETAYFSVVAVNQPAPVPLPAGALLLPAALAGFGLMHRRKKAATYQNQKLA